MIPKEIIDKVRRIQIHTTRMVNDVFAGEYKSVFKGRGMEFEEVREYQPGDDIRTIDWNVTARMGHPYVKRFVEERELTVMLLVDMSASQDFGTVQRMKKELAAELGAVLAFSAISNKDKVGCILFTDKVERFIPPRKGIRHVLRVIREILYFSPENKATDINVALEYLGKVQIRSSVVFLISDFVSPDFKRALKVTNKKHDVICMKISDPKEKKIDPVGLMEVYDPETGEKVLIDTTSKDFQKRYKEEVAKREDELRGIFIESNVDYMELSTGSSYVEPLMKFFRIRERRKVRI